MTRSDRIGLAAGFALAVVSSFASPARGQDSRVEIAQEPPLRAVCITKSYCYLMLPCAQMKARLTPDIRQKLRQERTRLDALPHVAGVVDIVLNDLAPACKL